MGLFYFLQLSWRHRAILAIQIHAIMFVCDNLSLCKICCIIYSINTGADIACQAKVESLQQKKAQKRASKLQKQTYTHIVVNKREYKNNNVQHNCCRT